MCRSEAFAAADLRRLPRRARERRPAHDSCAGTITRMSDRSRLPGWDAVVDEAPAAGAMGTGVPTVPPPVTAPGTFGLRIFNVSEVARAIREAVRSDPRLGDLWIEGEVGRVTVSSAGHAYFTLKDARSTLACVWFSDDRARSAFQAQAG